MFRKLRILIVSMLIVVLCMTTVVLAGEDVLNTEQMAVVPDEEELQPMYNAIAYISPSLAFDGREACVDVMALTDTDLVDRMKVTVKLYRISGSSETLVKTWTDQIAMADEDGYVHFYDYYTVSSAGTYKFIATGTMHRNNLVIDNFEVNSNYKTCS